MNAKKLQEKIWRVRDYIQEPDLPCADLLESAEQLLGLRYKPTYDLVSRLNRVTRAIGEERSRQYVKKRALKKGRSGRKRKGRLNKWQAFYDSYAWSQVRYDVLKASAGRCELCGRSNVALHVDHIKPIRKYWALRLEPENLQVLCADCNKGKGSRDETDWRKDE